MEWVFYLVAALFSILGGGCVVLVVLGLPGTWILLGMAFLIELLDQYYLPAGDHQTFNWWLLGSCLALAAIGEILEFFAGLLGAKKAGSSKRGMMGAFIGGLVGAVFGTGIPVPIVGTLIGAVLGTFAGAMIGELTDKEETREFHQTLKPAMGATIGRILGTLSKVPIALAIWLALALAVFWP
ncbi:MAG: DUF456 domain-containing protein [Acidobacteriota bacterium]|nr:DUF456 domain-containing protein [Acidobacteriota bacterium]